MSRTSSITGSAGGGGSSSSHARQGLVAEGDVHLVVHREHAFHHGAQDGLTAGGFFIGPLQQRVGLPGHAPQGKVQGSQFVQIVGSGQIRGIVEQRSGKCAASGDLPVYRAREQKRKQPGNEPGGHCEPQQVDQQDPRGQHAFGGQRHARQ